MNATDILRAAGEAGLVVSLSGSSLEVRGPEDARLQFLPMVAVAGKEIAKLIRSGSALNPSVKCAGYRPTTPCPACGIVHGRLADDPCSQCGEDTWVASVVGTNGARICGRCTRGA